VILVGVPVARCGRCGETEVGIPGIEALHRAIAGALIAKPARLAPEEVRFLRKHLGLSSADFAALLDRPAAGRRQGRCQARPAQLPRDGQRGVEARRGMIDTRAIMTTLISVATVTPTATV